jgi:Holliday junction resolvase
MTPEGKVKHKVTELLIEYGTYFFKPTTGGYGRSGIPDIVGCVNGKFFAIECKAGDNTPTPLQLEEMRTIRAHKGVAFTINEQNINLLEQWLEEQSKINPNYKRMRGEKIMTVPTAKFAQKRIKIRISDDYND